jgi:hypothetical protein
MALAGMTNLKIPPETLTHIAAEVDAAPPLHIRVPSNRVFQLWLDLKNATPKTREMEELHAGLEAHLLHHCPTLRATIHIALSPPREKQG